ncbi:hypothetical protein HB364_28215 [Pseudoflavitalea sp. X16]|uniref:hypothetical protein n=1 Tax=Paraflavitalea devenefica TaxID=2716334 RepID=UPI00141FB00D|nr:hypothetical protein [Paraflavitalea devenefica]NII28996.1 hypothetical protein [Paraflavitalea devenefica]
MKNIDAIKARYLDQGVREDNFLYAVDAVKAGSKREHILESLTADYRGMDYIEATQLLEELFAANGGEFKKENRSGYLYGAFFLLLGLAASFYIYYVYTYGGILVRPILIWAMAIVFTLAGLGYILLSFIGGYRDSDEPFKD